MNLVSEPYRTFLFDTNNIHKIKKDPILKGWIFFDGAGNGTFSCRLDSGFGQLGSEATL